MATNQFKPTSEASQSQSEYKKASETKSLKRLKEFISRTDLLGVDTGKAKIDLTDDVLEFCKMNDHRIVGSAIYFNSCGVM